MTATERANPCVHAYAHARNMWFDEYLICLKYGIESKFDFTNRILVLPCTFLFGARSAKIRNTIFTNVKVYQIVVVCKNNAIILHCKEGKTDETNINISYDGIKNFGVNFPLNEFLKCNDYAEFDAKINQKMKKGLQKICIKKDTEAIVKILSFCADEEPTLKKRRTE